MAAVRWVHLVSAVLWFGSAAVGLRWAYTARTRRSRHRILAIVVLALVIGAENLLQAVSVHHPRAASHLIANLALAVAGLAAFFVAAMYGRDLVIDERLIYALSRGRLGSHDRGHAAPSAASAGLTPREVEVVRYLCQGLGTEEIAMRLSVSPHTITTHVRNILRKLEVSSRADAVVWAVEHGLAVGGR